VVDAEILFGDGEGHCRVRVFGVEAPVRCEPGRVLSNRPGRLCLRAEDLVAEAPGGFAARVLSSTFKGSHTRLVVEPVDAPGTRLPVNASAPFAAGAVLRVGLRDGWLLPAGERNARPETARREMAETA